MQPLLFAGMSDRLPLHECGHERRSHGGRARPNQRPIGLTGSHVCRTACFQLSMHNDVAEMAQDSPRIQTRLQVMFFDTDCGGVVHNIAYLRFIEIARTLLAAELGMSLRQMSESQRYPVVVRTEIDYRRGAQLGDELLVEGWLDRLERARFWGAFHITP